MNDKNLPAARRKKTETTFQVSVRDIRFREEEPFRVESVLANIRRWSSYTPEYLEKKVNEHLGTEVQERLGRGAARLTDVLKLEPEDFQVGERSLNYPGAHYEISYSARDKKRGVLLHSLEFREPMLGNPAGILLSLGGLAIEPSEIVFGLPFPFEPISCVKGLKKAKWTIESQLPQSVTAHHADAGYSLRLEPSEITLFRFPSASLWADPSDPNAGNLLVSLMQLIGKLTAQN